jgi:hypothetical protein
MDDEQKWKRTKTQPEWGGFGRWGGGGPRTAIGMAGEGGRGGPSGAIQTRVAISHSNPAVEFALYCALTPLHEDALITISSKTLIDFESRSPRQHRIADIIICEPDVTPIQSPFSQSQSNQPRIIALVPTHTSCKYYFRFYRNAINVCLWRFGYGGLVHLVHRIVQQTDTEVILDRATDDFFNPYYRNRLVSLTALQRNLLRRLTFPEKVLLAELDISRAKLDEQREEILQLLNVATSANAIKVAEDLGVTQLSCEPDDKEYEAFKMETLATISSWTIRNEQH